MKQRPSAFHRTRTKTASTGFTNGSPALFKQILMATFQTCWTLFLLPVSESLASNDWPTSSFNSQRNAYTPEQIEPSRMELAWHRKLSTPPNPAWHGPAKWDAYGDVRMHSMRNYDEVFQLIGVAGDVFFGSSVDDTLTCLDAESGREKWSFFAEGPIRIAPTFSNGKLYFGSDDGYAYCIQASDGELVWKFRPQEPKRLVLNNGRFIPQLPIRSGVIVDGGVAYFAASLLPWSQSFLCAVDAETGRTEGDNLFVREFDNMTFEGPLALSQRLIIAPQGRVPPVLFKRPNGDKLGPLKGGGGSFVVVLSNDEVVHGPGNKTGWVSFSSTQSREQLATHSDARSLVLDNNRTYILTKSSVAAIERPSMKEVWRVPCAEGLSLIGVGDALFVGKPNEVQAFSAKDGTLQWTAPVAGKVFGLSFAQKRLLVSTDLGEIYAFTPTGPSKQIPDLQASQDRPKPQINVADLEKIVEVDDPGLVSRWVFQPPYLRGFSAENLAQGLPASISGALEGVQVGKYVALSKSGNDTNILISDDLQDAQLPESNLTVEAWVRVDKAQAWGGIIGALQDNGNDEKGWVLGYREDKFCIGLASKNGNGRITYLTAKQGFTPRSWHHVAGTYDGKTLRLIVDGKLAASSSEQRGPINYASEGPYVIGAYRDRDENFPLTGMLHEIRVHERALSVKELRKNYRLKIKNFPDEIPQAVEPQTFDVAVGPWLQFTKPGEAIIRWKTSSPSPTKLSYRLDGKVEQIIEPKRTRDHEVRLAALERNRLYLYSIEFLLDGQFVKTPEYECDTFFNYNLLDTSATSELASTTNSDDTSYREAAGEILKQSQVERGLCLDWNSGDCRLAEELIRQSQLRIVCVSSNEQFVASARRRFRKLGWYGSRVVVRHAESLDQLSLTPHWANLVVSGTGLTSGNPGLSVEQIQEVLAPTGVSVLGVLTGNEGEESVSTAFDEWSRNENHTVEEVSGDFGRWVLIRGKQFEGTGEWPYIYGGADNAAYAGESLGGAKTSSDLDVQWLGRPGPRYQADRSGRKTPPLSFGGRLFLEGLHRILALDSYNGSVLWSLEIPHFERFNIPRDCANWCGDGDSLFAAVRDRCWQIDTKSGQVVQMYALPPAKADRGDFDWGYIASAGETLVGSAVKRGTFYTNFWGGAGWYDAAEGPETFKVCSDALLGYDKKSGKNNWVYARGLVINSTITMGNGRLFFVEGRNKKLRSADTRRLNSPELWSDQFLVALNLATGKPDWEIPLDTVDGTVVFFMAHNSDKLVIVSSTGGKYHVYAVDDSSGTAIWDATFPWGREGKADHGSHLSRPAIVGNRLFVRPTVLDLSTGKIRDERVPEGKCGTYCCTDYALFFRGDPGARFAMWSSTDNQYSQWIRLRPDCWLSSIPAGGMLLAPEGGGGCSCGSWMETSVGFIPTAHLNN